MKGLFAALLLATVLASAASESDLADKFPKAKGALPFMERFPMLARFLALDDPWKVPARDLAAKLFPAQVKLVRGSDDSPLLFAGQRSSQWPGLPVWNQLAYETEYYVFDPARPVIRLHIGRPLEAGMHLIDYSQSAETKALFPVVDDATRTEMAYTNLEEYLKGTDPARYVDYRDPRNNRDRRISGGD